MFVHPGSDVKEDEGKETHSVCVFLPSFHLLCLFCPASNIPSQSGHPSDIQVHGVY